MSELEIAGKGCTSSCASINPVVLFLFPCSYVIWTSAGFVPSNQNGGIQSSSALMSLVKKLKTQSNGTAEGLLTKRLSP